MSEFLRDKDSDSDLVIRMSENERPHYLRFGHLRIESAFAGRIFVVYQPNGLNALGKHRDPIILTTLEILDFVSNSKAGSSVRLQDQKNGSVMMIDHIPRRVFSYELFMAVPSRMLLRWSLCRMNDNGIDDVLHYLVKGQEYERIFDKRL